MVCIKCGSTQGHLNSCPFYNTDKGYVSTDVFFAFRDEKNKLQGAIKNCDTYVIVTWPESQYFLGRDDCHLVNDENGINKFGSSAYFVPTDVYLDITVYNELGIDFTKNKSNEP